MTRPDSADGLTRQSVFAAALLISGFASVALSFIVAHTSTGRAAWSQEQALQYQAASDRLHGLSHEFAQAAREGKESSVRAELDRAQAEYNDLLGQLEGAIARPQRIAMLLRVAGLLLIAVGALSLYWGRSSRGRQTG